MRNNDYHTPRRTSNTQERPISPKRRSSAPRNIFLSAIILSIVAVSAYAINALLQEPLEDISGYADIATPSLGSPAQTNYQSQSQEASQLASQMHTFNELAAISNGHLQLVNMDFAVPDGTPGDLVRISNHAQTLNPTTLLREDALTGLVAMLDSAAIEEGFIQFRVTQGFRTQEYQQNLYSALGESGIAAPPGHSEHQVGLAIDISYHGVNIGNSPQGAWLMENSYRYGFILRYPEHKTDITGIPFEPWHYRYVGQPHAYFMFVNDLVLEEYIELLRRDGEITIVYRHVTYRVVYLSNGDTIEIPEGHLFNASLDNTGGIIVTV